MKIIVFLYSHDCKLFPDAQTVIVCHTFLKLLLIYYESITQFYFTYGVIILLL